jgi:excisionase family DNA binding protein
VESNYPRRLASVPQVAAYLGLSARCVWNWVYSRRIPVIRIAGTVRIDLTEVERLLDAGTVPARVR